MSRPRPPLCLWDQVPLTSPPPRLRPGGTLRCAQTPLPRFLSLCFSSPPSRTLSHWWAALKDFLHSSQGLVKIPLPVSTALATHFCYKSQQKRYGNTLSSLVPRLPRLGAPRGAGAPAQRLPCARAPISLAGWMNEWTVGCPRREGAEDAEALRLWPQTQQNSGKERLPTPRTRPGARWSLGQCDAQPLGAPATTRSARGARTASVAVPAAPPGRACASRRRRGPFCSCWTSRLPPAAEASERRRLLPGSRATNPNACTAPRAPI